MTTLLCDRCDHPYDTRNLSSPVCIRCAVAADSVDHQRGWARPLTAAEIVAAADTAARREDAELIGLYGAAARRRGDRRGRYARHLKALRGTTA